MILMHHPIGTFDQTEYRITYATSIAAAFLESALLNGGQPYCEASIIVTSLYVYSPSILFLTCHSYRCFVYT